MNHRCVLLLLAAMSGSAIGAIERHSKDPVDCVSPNIGGIGQLLTATIPYVQCPHGMARLAPVTTPGITDRYLADKIYGFPAGPAMLMASVGKADTHAASYHRITTMTLRRPLRITTPRSCNPGASEQSLRQPAKPHITDSRYPPATTLILC
jgi:hypothetical protein